MNQITTTAQSQQGRIKFDLMDPVAFNHIQRVAGMYAASPLFPEHLRKGSQASALANAVLVLNMADRLGEDPLTVAQNIYFVSGKPGWSASYMIAKANMHGVFKDPIEFDAKGKGEDLEVTAHAVMKGTGKKVSAAVSFRTAKAEGWTRNSKYQSMPETMLTYRAATALIRRYCPEVMIGVPPGHEVEDDAAAMRDVTPATAYDPAPDDVDEPEIEDAEIEEEQPKAKPVAGAGKVDRTRPAPAKTPEPDWTAEAEAEGDGDVTEESQPEAEPEAEEETAAEPEQKSEPKQEAKKEAKRETKGADESPARWMSLANAILADFKDSGGDADSIESFYGDQLETMLNEAPAIYEKVMEQMRPEADADA